MASVILNTTPWFASGALTSPEMRYALGALCEVPANANIGSETGVFPSVGGLAVSANGGTQVAVQPGACVVQTPAGGTYIVTVPVATNVTVTAQATNARIDLVCVRVLDTEADASGTPIQAQLLTVEGTAASSPSVPATPTGYLKLAEARVSSSGITVTDRRQFTRAAGGVRTGTDNDQRNGSYPGDTRIWPNGRIDVWTGAAWVSAAAPSVWSQEGATLFYDGPPQGTVNLGTGAGLGSFVRYKRAGNDLTVSFVFRWGGDGNWNGGFGNITTRLPKAGPNGTDVFTPSNRDQWIPCQLWVNNAVDPAQDWAGMALIQASSNVVRPYFSWNTGSNPTGIAPYKIAVTNQVPGQGTPRVTEYPEGGTLHIGPAVVELA